MVARDRPTLQLVVIFSHDENFWGGQSRLTWGLWAGGMSRSGPRPTGVHTSWLIPCSVTLGDLGDPAPGCLSIKQGCCMVNARIEVCRRHESTEEGVGG